MACAKAGTRHYSALKRCSLLFSALGEGFKDRVAGAKTAPSGRTARLQRPPVPSPERPFPMADTVKATQTVNFAQGAIAMIGTYLLSLALPAPNAVC